MQPRHHMPGLTPDQVYTYPAKRWRKKRRSYLVTYAQSPKKKEAPPPEADVEVPTPVEHQPLLNISSVVQQTVNEDSKDSTAATALSNKDEASKVCLQFHGNEMISLMICSILCRTDGTLMSCNPSRMISRNQTLIPTLTMKRAQKRKRRRLWPKLQLKWVY